MQLTSLQIRKLRDTMSGKGSAEESLEQCHAQQLPSISDHRALQAGQVPNGSCQRCHRLPPKAQAIPWCPPEQRPNYLP
ncbi:hypothetical protein DPEC_G00238100 [Dallia pectoralis]|uniref:Uncharacterized protein n=1 Tax=Dallia pectoralis TaxID=75939 RepID=A0ACC2FZ78_DALPE|nr:hypothetical protein DPEC_G00238100 [Dallia pectoralis]